MFIVIQLLCVVSSLWKLISIKILIFLNIVLTVAIIKAHQSIMFFVYCCASSLVLLTILITFLFSIFQFKIQFICRYYWKIFYQLTLHSTSYARIVWMTYIMKAIHVLLWCLRQYQIIRNFMMKPMSINKDWNVWGFLMKLFVILTRYNTNLKIM